MNHKTVSTFFICLATEIDAAYQLVDKDIVVNSCHV